VVLRRSALAALFALLTIASSLCVEAAPSRRVDVHLYVAGTSGGAPLAAWHHSIGITDVWPSYPKGAFPVDAGPDLQGVCAVAEIRAAGTLDGYRKNHIRYWFFEQPVPDHFYGQSKRADDPKASIWDSSPETDALWAGGLQQDQGHILGGTGGGLCGNSLR